MQNSMQTLWDIYISVTKREQNWSMLRARYEFRDRYWPVVTSDDVEAVSRPWLIAGAMTENSVRYFPAWIVGMVWKSRSCRRAHPWHVVRRRIRSEENRAWTKFRGNILDVFEFRSITISLYSLHTFLISWIQSYVLDRDNCNER